MRLGQADKMVALCVGEEPFQQVRSRRPRKLNSLSTPVNVSLHKMHTDIMFACSFPQPWVGVCAMSVSRCSSSEGLEPKIDATGAHSTCTLDIEHCHEFLYQEHPQEILESDAIPGRHLEGKQILHSIPEDHDQTPAEREKNMRAAKPQTRLQAKRIAWLVRCGCHDLFVFRHVGSFDIAQKVATIAQLSSFLPPLKRV